MTEQATELEIKACAAGADLMAPREPEPFVPEPRDPEKGLQTDELYVYANLLAEWGARGWARLLDWQERERTLGTCVH